MYMEKVINYPYLTKVGVAKYLRGTIRCPKSNFPIVIIVFDKHKLLINVNQSARSRNIAISRHFKEMACYL